MRTVAGADMAITGQELRSAKPNVWRNLSGPLLAVSAIAFVEVLARTGFKIPNPPAIFVLIVAFSAFYGGTRFGLVSAALAWIYTAYHFSIPGQPFHYTSENFVRVMMWAVTIPAMALMIGFLKSRATHVSDLTAINTTLKAQIIERKRAEDEVRLLQGMTAAVSQADDLYSAIEVVLRKVCESTGWVVGQAWMLGEASRIECVPAWYTSVPGMENFRKVRFDMTFVPGDGLPGRVWCVEETHVDTRFDARRKFCLR